MVYTLFFLLGIPFWLIASTRVFRSDAHPLGLKIAWAATALFAPMIIFGATTIAHVMIQQHYGEAAAMARGFGYVSIAANLLAFFSPLFVSQAFDVRYGSAASLLRNK